MKPTHIYNSIHNYRGGRVGCEDIEGAQVRRPLSDARHAYMGVTVGTSSDRSGIGIRGGDESARGEGERG